MAGSELPRTEGTRKAETTPDPRNSWSQAGGTCRAPSGADSVEALIARFARGRDVSGATTLEELGLSSLERVELMVALEDRFQTRIDEAQFSRGGEHRRSEDSSSTQPTAAEPVEEPVSFPSWNRSWPRALVRRLSLATWILPLARVFAHLTIGGREHLKSIDGPVRLRGQSSEPHGRPGDPGGAAGPMARARRAGDAEGVLQGALLSARVHAGASGSSPRCCYYLAAFYFNAFPLPQREAGARQTLQYIGELTGDGWSILIFPEGVRSETGDIKPFRGGIGMIASRLEVPVVPGPDRRRRSRAAPDVARWRGPAAVRVTFGAPMRLRGDDYAALARQVEDAGRAL